MFSMQLNQIFYNNRMYNNSAYTIPMKNYFFLNIPLVLTGPNSN